MPDHALVEFVREDSGAPWPHALPGGGSAVLCDPGHALEFVGLAAKFLLAARARGRSAPGLAELAAALPRMLATCFSLGFRPGPGGIVKAVDLAGGDGATINDDMACTLSTRPALAIPTPTH